MSFLYMWCFFVLVIATTTTTSTLSNAQEVERAACFVRSMARGAGSPPSSCPTNAFEKSGGFCYQPCQEGYKGIGPLCWKKSCSSCVEGSTDEMSYVRGKGHLLTCTSQQEMSGGFCYKPCKNVSFLGEGPICWETEAPEGFSVKCSMVLWASNQETCDILDGILLKSGGLSAGCIVAAFSITVSRMLLPLAQFLCQQSVKSALDAVQEIVQLTGAKACP